MLAAAPPAAPKLGRVPFDEDADGKDGTSAPMLDDVGGGGGGSKDDEIEGALSRANERGGMSGEMLIGEAAGASATTSPLKSFISS